MVRVEKVREDVYDPTTGTHTCVLDLQVSEATDLPAKDSTVGNATVAPGSIAQIIQTGAFVTLDDDGTWYPEQS